VGQGGTGGTGGTPEQLWGGRSMVHSSSWKRAEREIAQRVGGKRVPVETMDEPIDERELVAAEIHEWRKRQPKFCYPTSLAADIGIGAAAALYYVLCAIARHDRIINDSDICDATGCCPADIAAARDYGQRCGFLVAAQLCSNTWKYELQLAEFSKWVDYQSNRGSVPVR